MTLPIQLGFKFQPNLNATFNYSWAFDSSELIMVIEKEFFCHQGIIQNIKRSMQYIWRSLQNIERSIQTLEDPCLHQEIS